jgi:hypothetical protein
MSVPVKTSDDAVEFAAEIEDLANHWSGNELLTPLPEAAITPIAPTLVLAEMELTRNVSVTEVAWLPRDLQAGEHVMRVVDSYGYCSPQGTPCRLEAGGPYYEIPNNALKTISTWAEDGIKARCKHCSAPLHMYNGGWVSGEGHSYCPNTGPDHALTVQHVPGKTPKPTLSQETLDLRTKAKSLRAQYEEALAEALTTETPTAYLESQIAILRDHALDATVLASRKQTLELLADCLGPGLEIKYVKTESAGSLSSGGDINVEIEALLMPTALAQFFQVGDSPTMLVRGRLPGYQHRHWYVETPCAEMHDGDPSFACVRLRDEQFWYGPNRLGTVEERRRAFDEDLDKVNKVVPLCPEHRSKTVKKIAGDPVLPGHGSVEVTKAEGMSGTSEEPGGKYEIGIQVGTKVSYEDMANPRRNGKVCDVVTDQWGTQFKISWEDGTFSISDLRQQGWTVQ